MSSFRAFHKHAYYSIHSKCCLMSLARVEATVVSQASFLLHSYRSCPLLPAAVDNVHLLLILQSHK